MRIILAIDGGGTTTRCIAVDEAGAVKGEGTAGPSNHLHVPIDAATEALRSATAAALRTSGAAPADVELVSAGLAGVDFDGVGAVEAFGMLRNIGFERAVVYGDMVIAHRGALAGAPGVVALAGTGSSVLGIAADATMIKIGGWGPLYGDQGSAHQLGRLGLTAAADAVDGSGPATSLVAALTNALAVATFRESVSRVYSEDASGQQMVAALGAVVDACAKAGDPVAVAICRHAGADLARQVSAVLRRMPAGERTVSYQGAVLSKSALVRTAFCEAVTSGAGDVEIRPPALEPIAGAVLLGAAAAGWQLPLAALENSGGV
jgi:N-acetylglucosamine kinase-like BadF-type ATPase